MLEDLSQRELIQELVTLRQANLERSALELSNQQYLQQLAEMEVELSNLKLQLESKESQIKKLKRKGAMPSPEPSNRDMILEEELRQLRPLVALKTQLAELTNQLDHSNRVKAQYEAKYMETTRALHELQQDSDYIGQLTYLKATKIPDLEKALADKEQENDMLRRDNETLRACKSSTNDSDTSPIRNMSSRTPDVFSNQYDLLQTQCESEATTRVHSPSLNRVRSCSPTSSVNLLANTSKTKLHLHKDSSLKWLTTRTKVSNFQQNGYHPSFLRSKRNLNAMRWATSPGPRNSTTSRTKITGSPLPPRF